MSQFRPAEHVIVPGVAGRFYIPPEVRDMPPHHYCPLPDLPRPGRPQRIGEAPLAPGVLWACPAGHLWRYKEFTFGGLLNAAIVTWEPAWWWQRRKYGLSRASESMRPFP